LFEEDMENTGKTEDKDERLAIGYGMVEAV
jgi:hypothetical protein